MGLIMRFRRFDRRPRLRQHLSRQQEIAFILSRYDHGAIPPAVFAVVEALRAEAAQADPGAASPLA